METHTSTIEESPVRELQDEQEYQKRREAVLRDPMFIAHQKFVQEGIARYKKSESYKRYLERDPAEREEERRKMRESGQLKDPVDAYMESTEYKLNEEFKRKHREMFLKSDRFLQSERGKEYLRQQQAQKEKETTE